MESLKGKTHSNLLFALAQVPDSPWFRNEDPIENETNAIFLYGSRIFMKLLEHSNSWKSALACLALAGPVWGLCLGSVSAPQKEKQRRARPFRNQRAGLVQITGHQQTAPGVLPANSGMLRKGSPAELIPAEPQSAPGKLC